MKLGYLINNSSEGHADVNMGTEKIPSEIKETKDFTETKAPNHPINTTANI